MKSLVPHMRRYTLLTLIALCISAAPVAAQQVTLSMRDGLVTLDARNVTVRQILTEWTRIGRVAMVNGDKVTGMPVTLQLTGVPERQALDIVLRGVAGYMVSARPAGAVLDAAQSQFDKVLILATSAAPAPPPPSMAGNAQRAQPAYQPPPVMPDQDDDSNDPADQPARVPPYQPGPVNGAQMGFPGNGQSQIPQGAPGAPAAAMPSGPQNGLPRFQNGGYPYPPPSGPTGTGPRGQSGPPTAPGSPLGSVPSGGAPGSVTPVPPTVTGPPITNPYVPPPNSSGPRPATN